MTEAQPLLLEQHLEPANGAVVTVQHEHGQGGELGGAVPTVATVDHHRCFPRLHLVCNPQSSCQDQLQTHTAQSRAWKVAVSFFLFYLVLSAVMYHYAHLDVLKPVSGLQIGEPVRVLDVWVDHVL